MIISVAPTETNLFNALKSFLLEIWPTGTVVIRGQVNRAPEPRAENFAVMWPLRRTRLSTNVDTYADVVFTASITGALMDVTSIETGTIPVGAQVFGSGLASGSTTVQAFASGSGGVGTYTVSLSQSAASQRLAAGGARFLQATEFVIQVDVHGPDSGNNVQVLSTLLRDPWGVERFASYGYDVVPLYADDPTQRPFGNEQQQTESRWSIDVHLQANELVSGVPQQFADTLTVDLVNVDAAFPP